MIKSIKALGINRIVNVKRDAYLLETFAFNKKYYLAEIIEDGSVKVVDPDELRKIADKMIVAEARNSTVISFFTGVGGGFPAILAGVSIDVIQYYAVGLRILQKLLYLYGYDHDVFQEGEMDPETEKLF